MNLEKFIVPKEMYEDDDEYGTYYWDYIYDKMSNFEMNRRTPEVGLNVVVTLTSWRGSSDADCAHFYLTDEELSEYSGWQYIHWNGIKVLEDGSVERLRDYADGGTEIVYTCRYGGFPDVPDEHPELQEALNDLIKSEEKAKEDAKAAKKAERARKKEEREKAEYERLKAKFK